MTVIASLKGANGESLKRLVTTEVTLGHQGEEVTAFRFSLDAKGKLVAGSVHNLQKRLRSAIRQ